MNQTVLQALVDKQVQSKNIHNMVVGIQTEDGRVNATAAAGIADPSTRAAMTVDTPYLLASIAKMYTAATILQLADQGRLDLEAPISQVLPASLIEGIHVYQGTDYSQQIKVYQLVNQTSGLPDYYEDKPEGGTSLSEQLFAGQDRGLSIQDMLDITRTLTPKFPPGTNDGRKAAYADTNYQLLGAIIEVITGQTVAQAFQAMIFDPLGLQHTYAFNAAMTHPIGEAAAVYRNDSPLHIPQFLTLATSDGGLVATAADSLTFLRAFFAGELFDKARFPQMKQWNGIFFPLQYGYGMMRFKLPWFFSPFKPVPELIGHSGSTGSFAFYSPAKALYMVGTINQVGAQRVPFQVMSRIVNAS